MQYAPPYYYGAPNQQSPNVQQAQPQGQQPQGQPPQQPQLQMPEHQLYHHGMPTYPMAMPPHQPYPAMVQPGGEFNMITKPKRKQVKNACVNCQKACKKCDDGRPCQRCVKYGLSETCTNSVRKERKKGVKRGPYKRRNQANEESSSPSSTSYQPTSGTGVPTPYPAYSNYDAYQSTTNPNVAYNSHMQQYVMAMQQQQAMYQNLPYQQPVTTTATTAAAATTSSPALSHHQPSSAPPSGQSSPAPTDAVAKTETKDAPAAAATDNTTTNNKDEMDENGSKLNILSQLCSAALEHPPKQSHAGTPDHPSPTPTHATNTSSSEPQQQQQQHTPVLSTPISSSPSSANASPTLHKQEPQIVYPQQQPQGQPHGENNWQGHW